MSTLKTLRTIGEMADRIGRIAEDIENTAAMMRDHVELRANGRRKALRLLKINIRAQKTELNRRRGQVEHLTEASLQANAALAKAMITQQTADETIRRLSRQAEQSCDDLVLWKMAPSERCRVKRIQDCHICDRIEYGDNMHPAMVEKRRLERLCGQHSEAVNKIGAVLKERDATILDLSGRVNRLCDDRSVLETEKDRLKDELGRVKTTFDIERRNYQGAAEQRDNALVEISQLKSTNSILRSMQHDLVAKTNELADKNADLDDARKMQCDKIERQGACIRELELQLAEYEVIPTTKERIGELEDEVTRLRTATRCPACQKLLMQGRFMHVEEVVALAEEMSQTPDPQK